MKILDKLLNIDPRIMYGLLILIIVLLLVEPVEMPIGSTRAVTGIYDTIEKLPTDKIVIISIVWSSSTMSENRPQTEAIMRHLFRRGIKFAILSWDQQGTQLAYDSAEKLSKEMGKKYGVDWCAWGYRVPYFIQILPALAKNIPGTIRKDQFGTDVTKIPMMRGVKNIHDVGMIAEVTGSKTVEYWIMFVQGVYGTKIAYATTLVGAPEGFNFLDAHQVVGMLSGLPGAGQYEHMLKYRGFGQIASSALSGSHLLIIGLIILGNVGLLAQRRRRETRGSEIS
ncbi:MAG: hypothetical protein Q7N50_08195 [Armatimonadota bacterium]|nr:hypothetical protein [Armatimonadota bacterium]